jgi:hypothetical protein
VFGQLLGGVLAGTLFRLRLKLQQMYTEHVQELAARQGAEGNDSVPLVPVAEVSAA